MDVLSLGGLAVLALVDSTSFGTLLIPLWMMLAPRVRASRLLVYLAVVSVFYFLVGLGLLAGLDAITSAVSDLAGSRPFAVVQLLVGAGLVVLSYAMDPAYERIGRKHPPGHRPAPSARAQRWQGVLTASDVPLRTVVVIALTATALEVATMLPYLAAVGIITTSGEPVAVQVGVLAAYVVVMVLPALLALALRLAARRLVEPGLARLSRWMSEKAGSAVAWVVGIVGVLIALNALGTLT